MTADSPVTNTQPPFLTIAAACACLRRGGVVAIPTETVYGLAADASQERAVARIFSIKGRPTSHPLIVHIGSVDQIKEWAVNIPEILWPLAERFWPGPLTVVLKKQPHVSKQITGGQDTVALRIPGHETLLQLLRKLKCGLAAPSANRFGHVSPTTPQHVIDELGQDIDGIVEGGACRVGIESTILDLSTGQPRILRPGQINQQDLESFLEISLIASVQTSPRAPGMLKAHYAPATPLILLQEEDLTVQIKAHLERSLKINVWSIDRPEIQDGAIFWQQMPKESQKFAQDMYHQLRQFDTTPADITLIQRPPELPEWRAVLDRLERAAAHFYPITPSSGNK